MGDPAASVVVRSKDNQVIASFDPESTGESVLTRVITKTGCNGTITKPNGRDVAGDETERLQPGNYTFTPLRAASTVLANSQLEVKLVEFKQALEVVQESNVKIEKMIRTNSEATRQASTISPEDLEHLKTSVRCVMVSCEDDEVKEGLEDNTVFQWADNKYEPQQQADYLAVLKQQVNLPSHAYWIDKAKDDPTLLRTSMWCGGADLPFPIGCKTEECISLRNSQWGVQAAIAATVEIKKKVVRQSLRQTETQWICASLKSLLPVISVVTDMKGVGVAYYTTGQKTPNGSAIVTQQLFSSAAALMQFLGTAVRNIDPTVLRRDSEGNFNLPEILQKPKRRRLPTAPVSPTTFLQRVALVQQVIEGSDVANLADLEPVPE